MEVAGDRSLSVRAVAGTFAVLAWISVSLRSYVRLRIVKSFGWDDGLIVVALAFYTMFCAFMITASFYGTGKHEANLTPEHTMIALRLWWLCEVSYGLASVATKASICLFLLRITVRKSHVWILYSVMAVTVLTGVVFLFVLLLQCHPISYFWDKGQPGHCVGWNVIIAMSWLWSIFAGMCDFTVGILPIFLVWNLNMDRRTKIAVASILGLACIASCAVIIRMPFLHTFSNPDFLWATTDLALWTNIEVGLGIFASSLATLRPLFRILQSKSQRGTDEYQNSDRLRPNYHQGRSKNALQNDSTSHSADGARRFRPQKNSINMTPVSGITRGYDSNGSDDHLNQPSQITNPDPESLEHKNFNKVTATERVPLESV